jgi:hypothetical protein
MPLNCRNLPVIPHEIATISREIGWRGLIEPQSPKGYDHCRGQPMNHLVLDQPDQTALTPAADAASLGWLDPADDAAGEVLFLAEDQALFSHLAQAVADSAAVAAPVPGPVTDQPEPFAGETAEAPWAIAPHLPANAVLMTDKGETPAVDLQPGQRILTRDRGFQTVLWVGHRRLPATALQDDPGLRPVTIAAGALGTGLPAQDLSVPQSQRLLVEGPRTKLMFGQHEVFVPAAHLVGYPGIAIAPAIPEDTTAVFILCARHEVIWVDGVWTESLQAGIYAAHQIGGTQHADIEKILAGTACFPAARRSLRRHEADLLLA